MKDKEVYQKSLELFNNCCALCGSPYVQCHHIRYGAVGRKTYMGNIIPLCEKHFLELIKKEDLNLVRRRLYERRENNK